MTDPASRYHGAEVASLETADGRPCRYLRRRFLPQVDDLHVVAEHVLTRGDRPDLISADHLGDAELFWRLCDANPVLHPDELTGEDRIGTAVRIPFPVA
ncbi:MULTISPECIES: LysM domain-containing protein [unclassified Amycolatopsis]|uniref:LysM domain-containing protein n=1 Tax=unclassified Amycolatopsis TaxID=2618356 RepID=UPI002E2402CA|nr:MULTISPECIES: LysM domain-containing protein [unclassified Amycolatopsis]